MKNRKQERLEKTNIDYFKIDHTPHKKMIARQMRELNKNSITRFTTKNGITSSFFGRFGEEVFVVEQQHWRFTLRTDATKDWENAIYRLAKVEKGCWYIYIYDKNTDPLYECRELPSNMETVT